MKQCILFVFLSIGIGQCFAQLQVTEVGKLPEKVSNNAVCEGFVNDTAYLYSFGGIDFTKNFKGIHLRCYKYNTQTKQSSVLPSLPDTLGKIGCAANRIGNIIYIMGGYHVLANKAEKTSNKVHRFNILTDQFLSDGQAIPYSTDDHVQCVWKDSLIYLITGWSDVANIANVQLYNPSKNSWERGSSVPNNNTFKSFGASGYILEDTIFYFGGATSGIGFGAQNGLRKGIINPLNPKEITWSNTILDNGTKGYRMACTSVKNEIHWIGGSTVTYNYNGIAYDGSGGVAPSNRDLFFTPGNTNWGSHSLKELPMDLRGIANVNDTVKYLAGGMLMNQTVTDKIFKIEYSDQFNSTTDFVTNISVYPNPFTEKLHINTSPIDKHRKIEIFSLNGKKVQEVYSPALETTLNLSHLKNGMYFLKITSTQKTYTIKLLKQ